MRVLKVFSLVALAGAVLLMACGGASPGGTGGGSGSSGGGSGGGGGPLDAHLVSVPDCGTPGDGGTAQELFTAVVMNQGCAAGGCHGTGAGFNLFELSDGASMRSAWVNVKSVQSPRMNRVTPGDIDQSYVVYKLMNQQRDAGGTADQMPQGGPYLNPGDLCRVINWVRAGAR